MENKDRAVEPNVVIQALQQFLSNEVSRYSLEVAYRDAYIQTIEAELNELKAVIEKLNGNGQG